MPALLTTRCLPFIGLTLATALHLLAEGGVQVSVKDNKGLAVADAVVSLMPLDTKPTLAPFPDPLIIAQRGQEFDPYVTAIVVGSKVSFPNRDTVRHQVYSLSKPKPFEIPLYGPGADQTVTFDQPGVVSLGCNIHDWMSAHLVILATPFFKKTPADGSTVISSLPPGRYRLDVWHPRLATDARREVTIAVGDSSMQTIAVVLKPDRRIRRAPDGAGGGYK